MKTLVALLVASTALFTLGAIAERAQPDTHTEAAAEPEGAHAEAGEVHSTAAHTEANENLLGIDTESVPLIALAALAGLGLAALAASRFGRMPAVLLAIAVIVTAWAALDVREAVHQLDESRTGIALLAVAVGVLHLAAAAIAGLGSRERSDTIPA